jgi:hypothetical protein
MAEGVGTYVCSTWVEFSCHVEDEVERSKMSSAVQGWAMERSGFIWCLDNYDWIAVLL